MSLRECSESLPSVFKEGWLRASESPRIARADGVVGQNVAKLRYRFWQSAPQSAPYESVRCASIYKVASRCSYQPPRPRRIEEGAIFLMRGHPSLKTEGTVRRTLIPKSRPSLGPRVLIK